MVTRDYIDGIINKSSNNNQICQALRNRSDEVIEVICNYLGIIYIGDITLMQMIYHYKEGITEIEKCICDKNRKYHCYGYRKTCGDEKCINEVRELSKKKTCLDKYGKEYVTQVDTIKEKMSNSIFERYGVYNPTKSMEVINKRKENNFEKYGYYETLSVPSIRKKIEETNLDRFGHLSPLGSIEIREKIKKTNLLIFGFDNPQKNPQIKKKTMETMMDNNIIDRENNLRDMGYHILSNVGDTYDLRCMDGHDFTISRSWLNLKLRNNITICNECMGISSKSIEEINILKFIKDNYTGEVIHNDRMVLDGMEIDIYLPELKLGIEYNGLYWHSELFKEDNYHSDKSNKCESYGVQLIHIFEDEWLFKRDIIKSRLLNLLGGSNKIYARKCEIRKIDDNKLIREFLLGNHTQGFVGSRIKLGLFYNDELVSLMTFGNLRKNMGQTSKEGSFELLRFCNKLNTSVVGGASRLFEYFMKNHSPKYILSYADRRWSNGNLYEKLGFEFNENTVPNFYYVKSDKNRLNRFNFRKDILVKEGYDNNKTERLIMLERGYYRVYDCGSKRYSILFDN